MGYGGCVHIVYEHRATSCTDPWGQAGVNPYTGCAEIARKSCNLSAGAVQSLHRNQTEPVRLPVVSVEAARRMVRWRLCSRCIVFECAAYTQCLCGDCAMPPTTCLRATDLRFFSNLYNFTLNKFAKAAEPVNPYKNLTAASCLRTEATRKGDTGRLRGS